MTSNFTENAQADNSSTDARRIAPPTEQSSLVLKSLATAHRLETRRRNLERRAASLGARVRHHQTARLTVAGLFLLFMLVAAGKPGLGIGFPAFAVLTPIFIWLVLRTRNLQQHERRLKKLDSFYARQHARCLGQPSGRDFVRAASYAAPHHSNSALTRDFALFGAHSIWTLLDETLTDQGESELTNWLLSDPRSVAEIQARQKTVRSLKREVWFYTKLTLLADAAESRISTQSIEDLLKRPFLKHGFSSLYALTLIFWLLLVGLVIADVGFGPLASETRVWPFAFALFNFTNFYTLFRSGSGFKQGVGLTHHLSLLEPILGSLEKRTMKSEELKVICPTVATLGPSRHAKRLSIILGFLGVETNPLLHLLTNAVLPWSVTGAFFLERARTKLAHTFPSCLRELAEIEALGSLVIFERYQTNTYPSLESGKIEISSGLHPLIDRNRAVANSFSFPKGKTLGLLTGSNMSGKSTFLRTIGVNQLLANIGAPVFAERFATRPLRIESCIEVSDSLRDGFSYFYAEVHRIKSLLDQAREHDNVLFLIDEIFRGTNNRERQIGSRAVIRSLAQSPRAQGFISTHDLELVALEDSEPALINLHFREDVIGSEMVFPYKLHVGPCPTTNALKIMELSGIRIELGTV